MSTTPSATMPITDAPVDAKLPRILPCLPSFWEESGSPSAADKAPWCPSSDGGGGKPFASGSPDPASDEEPGAEEGSDCPPDGTAGVVESAPFMHSEYATTGRLAASDTSTGRRSASMPSVRIVVVALSSPTASASARTEMLAFTTVEGSRLRRSANCCSAESLKASFTVGPVFSTRYWSADSSICLPAPTIRTEPTARLSAL